MNAETLLAKLNRSDEHMHVEGKTCSESVGRSFYETVCAFANTEGGHIVVGVEKKERGILFPTWVPVGVRDLDRVQQQIAVGCRESFNRPVTPRVSRPEEVDGEMVIVVYVPPASPAHRPIYFKRDGLPVGAYIRVSSTDHSCTDDDLPALFDISRAKYDSEVVEEARLADIDGNAVEQYRRIRMEVDPNADDCRYCDTDYLRGLRCVREVGGELIPTVAGLLLFGTSMARRQFFPFSRIDCIRTAESRWINEEVADKYPEAFPISGPLIWMAIKATQEIQGIP